MWHWLRKSFFVLITILTLGTVVPPSHLNSNASDTKSPSDSEIRQDDQESDEAQIEAKLEEDINSNSSVQLPWQEIARETESEVLLSKWVDYTLYQADIQMMNKFGTRIKSKVEEEYRQVIFPKLEETITTISMNADVETLRNFSITSDPAAGLGEKVFHVFDIRNGEELYRFHVRRDHPPNQGYWFDFHYHTYKDNFETHHDLGKIYWDKNTPPNWMSS
ncbi:YpjP family protein [Alkalihalobacillus sp. BA299]|uniref:YpjP family protein n=1 Tax=Alkalihalobacillus sp. BA299 TaxID=2815938 RepID=UPI001ADBB62E|nr:YpjP family protein [Alkalihalobacillus sp. BA299]